MTHEEQSPSESPVVEVRRHMRAGWWTLLVFLSLGAGLEALHAFKVGSYLDVANESRKLMWTLAHAHGTLLAVMNIVFALTLSRLPAWPAASRSLASRCLLGSTLLIPLGFFMGGSMIYDGDPGPGVLLVPPGALLLFVAIFMTARACAHLDSATRTGDGKGGRRGGPKRNK